MENKDTYIPFSIRGNHSDGEVVTSISSGDLVAWCEPLLGYLPPTGCASGNMIKLSWLNNEFQQLPNDVDKVAFAQHTQAHILSLIGGLLMQNTISSWVYLMYLLLLLDLHSVSNYSWGSIFLACLY